MGYWFKRVDHRTADVLWDQCQTADLVPGRPVFSKPASDSVYIYYRCQGCITRPIFLRILSVRWMMMRLTIELAVR